MSVRESVFVDEQNVPIENEYDDDDRRSHHWVTYASVSVSRPRQASTAELQPLEKQSKEEERRRSQPTSQKLPVGTVRIVPPPHAPHPAPSSHHKIDNAEAVSADKPAQTTAPATSVVQGTHQGRQIPGVGHIDPEEPFVKLGRLAVLQPYRKLGMGRMLLESALQWAGEHPNETVPRAASAAERERSKEHYRQNSDPNVESPAALRPAANGTNEPDEWDLGGELVQDFGPWKGLVLIHAQQHLERVYNKWGFVRDETLGVWDEEGIDHIGMWRRVKVNEQRL